MSTDKSRRSYATEYARFLAEKYQVNFDGWKYDPFPDDLEHIRYKRDYTGDYVWWRRYRRAFTKLFERDKGTYAAFSSPLFSPSWFLGRWFRFKIRIMKKNNLPDCTVNGNIFFWLEDGEYVTLFQPRVGMKVLDFLDAEPDHPHAKLIREEIEAVAETSWPKEDK